MDGQVTCPGTHLDKPSVDLEHVFCHRLIELYILAGTISLKVSEESHIDTTACDSIFLVACLTVFVSSLRHLDPIGRWTYNLAKFGRRIESVIIQNSSIDLV